MIVVGFLGAGAGLGIVIIWRSFAARQRLSDVGAALALPGRPALSTDAAGRSSLLEQRAVRWMGDLLRAAGMDPTRRAQDLRVSRRTVDKHVFAKLTGTVGFGGAGTFLGLVVGLGPYALFLGMAFALFGFYLPELTLTGEAREARRNFRHAYGAFLDLVNVQLAAGSGPESALHKAADAGGGWVFAELAGALESARRTRRSMGDALAELGEELDIAELRELAASINLVGSQGAKVRSTLASKADSLRVAQLAEAEANAAAATERMTLPVVVLLFGFLLFIAIPAVVRIGEIGQ